MNTRTLPLLVFVALVGSAVHATRAEAQPVEAGVNAPPAALILFDTSGSMEWRDDGPDHTFPTCAGNNQLLSVGAEGRSRMHAAVEVLTGEVPNRYCAEDDRDANPNRIDQYDATRPQGIRHSRLCSLRGLLTSHNADCMPADPATATPAFPQEANGLIDEFGDKIAFGFMAFDSFPEADPCTAGMFSYGDGRRMNHAGNVPAPTSDPDAVPTCNDSDPTCWNLGARRPYINEAGASNCVSGQSPQSYTVPPIDPSNGRTRDQINDLVQEQILRVVPYWSTPIGAMLEDAYHFYEGSPDYFLYRGDSLGHDATHGLEDPYGECRRRFVLLITDGTPSFQACVRTGSDGVNTSPWEDDCIGYPYADAPWYAAQLYNAGIPVYVVGFNISAESGDVLNEIAFAGGTDEARFAGSGLALVYELGDILSQISQGTPSRTSPANATRLSPSASDRGQFTFEANFEIHEGSPYWTGEVTRVSRFCSDGSLQNPVETNFSEWYDDLTISDMNSMNILTTSPQWHSCYLRANGTTASASPFRITGDNPLTEPYGVTDAEIAAACQSGDTPGSGTNVDPECEDLNDGDVGYSTYQFGGLRDSACLNEIDLLDSVLYPHLYGTGLLELGKAEMFLRWLRGWSLTELRNAGYEYYINEEIPSAQYRWDPDTNSYRHDRRSRLPAIVHSSPTVVGVPDARLQVSSAYADFVEDTQDRPTVLYTATADGLLRAINADTREEIFAFLPSYISHRIGETMSVQKELLDGSPVVADVRTYRDGSANERWMTVLLLPYRGAGRGVVALNVTDPENPRFLWEIDGELDPQLGLTYSRPAIGTIYMGECLTGTGPCERAVAIFGGGAPPSGLSNWETTNIGRTLYVVDVETGIVLRRFTHMRDNTGATVPIPSAVVGEVAGFDTFTGSLMTRAFVGTIDGQLLRLDMASTDPDEWAVDLFFDPDEELMEDIGGIFFKPTIALSRDNGRAVVVFGTGNLDDLDRVSGEQNYVISVQELPEFDTDGNLVRIGGELNWGLKLEGDERMTARPRIFNRRTYFATFTPAADPCDIGGARLYALDFIGASDDKGHVGAINTTDFTSYLREDPLLGDNGTNPLVGFHDALNYEDIDPQVIPPKAIIYAIEITERISCFEESATGDRGNNQNVTLEVSDQGEFVLQIGASSFADDGSAGAPQAVSQLSEMSLEEPPASIIPTSWSVVFE